MATKPTNTGRWAETAGGTPSADITEPSSGKKDSGWAVAEKPAAQYFNWWQNIVYTWILYLDDLVNQALTWTAAHTWQALGTFQKGVAITQSTSNTVALTATGNGTGGDIALGTNPSSTTGFSNKLTAANVPKAWGIIQGGSATLLAGFNIASVATEASGGFNGLRVTLATAMGSANYIVLCNSMSNAGTLGYYVVDSNVAGGRVAASFLIRNYLGGSLANANGSGNSDVYFAVFGVQ